MTAAPLTRVLVVDDEQQIRSTLAEILGLEGYEVAQATNGADALALLDPFAPDVVILDLWMPVVDGWAFRREQLRRRPDLQVIILSAARLTDDELDELARPRVIAKPFDLDALIGMVAEAARR